jgi:energy-coupling factor transport system permease protein
MLKNIPIGIYYPGKGLLHRLRARTKILLVVWLSACLYIANRDFWNFLPYIVLAALIILGIFTSGVSLRQFWLKMRLLLILILIGALPVLFTVSDSGSKTLYPLGPVTLSYGTLRLIIAAYLALFILYLLAFFLPIPSLQNIVRQRRVRWIRVLLILLALVALGALFFTRRYIDARTFPIGPLNITNTGVWSEMELFAVFLVLYTASLLLTMTTPPIALIEGMTRLLAPLRWLRLPVDEFALMTLIGLRFIPTLFEEGELLIKAQMARGADYLHGSLRERVQTLIALFVPFIQGVFRRAADLATALDARGYEIEGHQTYLHETRLTALDYAVLLAVAIVTVGVLIL